MEYNQISKMNSNELIDLFKNNEFTLEEIKEIIKHVSGRIENMPNNATYLLYTNTTNNEYSSNFARKIQYPDGDGCSA